MSDNITLDDSGNSKSVLCPGATDAEMEFYIELKWWMDGVFQIVIGLIGIAGNTIAMPILLSKKLSSIFNRILVFLALFDNIFISCSILESIRKNYSPLHPIAHIYAFAYFLYQLQAIAFVSSIFITVVLALERCLAAAKPIEYHNAIQGTNPWRRVIHYIVPVVMLSACFNSPKFWEIDVVTRDANKMSINTETNETNIDVEHVVYIRPSDLRMNDNYIFYYNNLAKLIITGIVPFAALCLFNYKIYYALKRRRHVMGPAHQLQLNLDNRQALVLFSIVFIFFVSSVPRIFLNLHEVFTIGSYKENIARGCENLPLWIYVVGNISQLLMLFNSSINFFIYAFMNPVFKEVLAENVSHYTNKICLASNIKILQCNGSCIWPSNSNDDDEDRRKDTLQIRMGIHKHP